MTDTPSPTIESKFRLVHIVSRRAEQLIQGARPKIDSKHAKRTRVALEEVNAGVIKWQLNAEVAAAVEGVDELAPDLLPTQG